MTSSPWPGKEADGSQIAQLALLRLLSLQREAHQAARAGHSESVGLLARTVIETCIVGLYCLVTPDAPDKLNDQNAHQLDAMLRYLPTEFVTEATRKRMINNLGVPKREPSTWAMAAAVDAAAAAGNDKAEMLYRAYYAPLSAFYAHGGGISLMRHVGRHNQLTEHPKAPWFHRSALHIIDSSVALLAAQIARATGQDATIFDKYYEAHRGRTLTPVFFFGGQGIISTIQWREVPGSLRAVFNLKAYLASERAARDTASDREAIVRAAAGKCLAVMRQPDDEGTFEVLVDALVEQLVTLSSDDAEPQTPTPSSENS